MQPDSVAVKQLNDTTKTIESLLQCIPADDTNNPSPVGVKARETLSKLYVSCVLCTQFCVCVHSLEAFVIYDSKLPNSQRAKITNTTHELEIKTDEEHQIMHAIVSLDDGRKQVSEQVGKYISGFEAQTPLCSALSLNFAS